MKTNWNFWYRISIIVWAIVMIFALWYAMDRNLKNKIEVEAIPIEYNIKFDLTKEHLLKLNQILSIKNKAPEVYYPISEEDRYVIECIVAGESKYEPLLGKMAVAQCILNAMIRDNMTANEVRIQYQYSGWDENLKSKDPEEWAEVCHAVWCVFDNGEKVTQENILWFYNPNKAAGKFHNTQKFVIEIGNHRFYSPWKDD